MHRTIEAYDSLGGEPLEPMCLRRMADMETFDDPSHLSHLVKATAFELEYYTR
jgi:hypothetical protein